MGLSMEMPAWWPGGKDKTDKTTKNTGGGKFHAAEPRVNLVPADAIRRAATRNDTRIGTGVLALALLGIGGLWFIGNGNQANAQIALDTETDRGVTLANQLAHYAPVNLISQQTQSLKDTVAAQTEREILHDQALAGFMTAVDGMMTINSIQVTSEGPGACVSIDPFETVPLAGCITFSGTGASAAAPSQIMAALNSQAWSAYAFIPTVAGTAEDGSIPVSGTVGLTEQALASNNFGDATGEPGDQDPGPMLSEDSGETPIETPDETNAEGDQ